MMVHNIFDTMPRSWALAGIAAIERDLPGDPIDLVEAFVDAHDWAYERCGESEIAARLSGQWCDLQLWFASRTEARSLVITCALDMRVPRSRRDAVYPLLAGINERLLFGHFELWSDGGWPTFRHTLVGDSEAPIALCVLEDVVDAARAECDRYYPAFQFVLWGGEDADGAIAASLIETEGEA